MQGNLAKFLRVKPIIFFSKVGIAAAVSIYAVKTWSGGRIAFHFTIVYWLHSDSFECKTVEFSYNDSILQWVTNFLWHLLKFISNAKNTNHHIEHIGFIFVCVFCQRLKYNILCSFIRLKCWIEISIRFQEHIFWIFF